MNNFTKRITAFAVVLIIMFASVISCFAAEELKINGVEGVKKNDIVTYELSLGDCTEGIVGLQMNIIYDRQYLDIVDNSFETPNLTSAVSNTQGDYITFNWTNVTELADFSEKKVMAKVDFKVLKGGKTDITYFVTELYGEDMTYLKSYTFTYDLAVNEEVKIDDETPLLTKNEEAQNKYQGMFVNYSDGKGEENGKKNDNKRETVVGETQAPSTFETGVPVEEATGNGMKKGIVPLLTGCAVFLLVCVIVALGIINNARNRKKIEESNKEQQETEETKTEKED